MTKTNYLNSGHVFEKDEKLLAFQFNFFNVMLVLAAFFSPLIAYIHKDINIILFYSDMAFSAMSYVLIILLRYDKKCFTLATHLFILTLYITITLVFFLAGEDPTKVIWAPILLASAFLLLGRYYGFLWLLNTLSAYFLGYYIFSEGIGYTLPELVLISISFIVVSTIFDSFREKNNDDNAEMMKINASLLQSTEDLEDFSSLLKERIEEGLIESQNKTKAIQHHLDIINKHVITMRIDTNGLVSNVSQAYCELSGYKKNHYISKPFTILFDINTPMQELKKIWNDLRERKELNFELKNLNQKGDIYWLDVNISSEYTQNNEHIGYLCIAHNISDKKLVLQHQDQLVSQSRHAAMGEMISMIAHQWRQPLGTIAAITTSIKFDIELKDLETEALDEKINKISSQVQHLSSTVDDFRDFFKPTKGIVNTYIHTLVQEAVTLLNHRLDQKVKLIYENKIDMCLALYHNELVQVLINIINNACDIFEEKSLNDAKIIINEFIQDNDIIIEIQDNAGGIDEKIMKHIFDPYFSTKTKNGTGLGLYMSKTIVQDHQKGKLEVCNVEDGVKFSIVLPIDVCKF
ncbi:PAS domain S-box protein [Sulfurimonas sp. MAG313]|nr:ATP-binding protein [Sulfurimonas sp. MAG313]MDF1880297.1 PAS domain S-box protein [Sulfurimonas sp. MAG313]